MNKIADALMPLLGNDGRFQIRRNTPDLDVNEMALDSNNFKADIHVAIHSNEGGGDGTEVYAFGPIIAAMETWGLGYLELIKKAPN